MTTLDSQPLSRKMSTILCCQLWGKPICDDEECHLGFTREQKGNSMPAQTLRKAKFPIDFSLPVGFVPPSLIPQLISIPRQEGTHEPEAGSDSRAGKCSPWSHGQGASTGPSRAIRLRGRRTSTGLSNKRLQPPGSLRYWKHMFAGEKEKKQLNTHTIAVSRRVRETRAHGWRGSGGGHGDGAPRHRLHGPGRAAAATPNLQPLCRSGTRRVEALHML